jgi:hypothetical protein
LLNQNHAHVDNANGELNHLAALHKIFQTARGFNGIFGDLSHGFHSRFTDFLRHSNQ